MPDLKQHSYTTLYSHVLCTMKHDHYARSRTARSHHTEYQRALHSEAWPLFQIWNSVVTPHWIPTCFTQWSMTTMPDLKQRGHTTLNTDVICTVKHDHYARSKTAQSHHTEFPRALHSEASQLCQIWNSTITPHWIIACLCTKSDLKRQSHTESFIVPLHSEAWTLSQIWNGTVTSHWIPRCFAQWSMTTMSE